MVHGGPAVAGQMGVCHSCTSLLRCHSSRVSLCQWPCVTLQVRSATERALFEARRREVEEERRVEAALLEKALELKDRAAAQRQALAAAARGQQTLIR